MAGRVQNGESRGRRNGSALIVAVWVIGLLSLLVISFAFDAQIEGRITSFYRKRAKAEYLARSGMEVADLLMTRSLDIRRKDPRMAEQEGSWWHDAAKRLSEGLPVQKFERPLGEGMIVLDVEPEPARRNVNKLTEDDWERILEITGVPEDLWPVLIESYFDWIDRDDDQRVDGAESDYYLKLDESYRAKNGILDTVDELLRIRGFNRAILYGGPLKRGDDPALAVRVTGIADMLTTYGDGKVNVNAASRQVLMTLKDVDPLAADAIMAEREGWVDDKGQKQHVSFQNEADLFARVPGLSPALRGSITMDSQIYRVTSIGVVGGVKRKMAAIVRYGGQDAARLQGGKKTSILKWQEED